MDSRKKSYSWISISQSICTATTSCTRCTKKSMNLYLYIPPNSADPHGLLHGLIFRRMQAYWHQNTEKKNFVWMAKLLAQRLITQAYSKQVLTPLFIEATLSGSTTSAMKEASNHACHHDSISKPRKRYKSNLLPLALPHHPRRGIKQATISKTFAASLKKLLPHRSLASLQYPDLSI